MPSVDEKLPSTMQIEDHAAPMFEGPKPVAATISTRDVQALFACNTRPDAYMQLILAKLKDNGCPAIEGMLHLRVTHGKVFKLKTSVLEEQDGFEYVWLPDVYVAAIAQGANPVC